MRLSRLCVIAAMALIGLSGCIVAFPAAEGKFERTLSVTGPVNLEVSTGSGKIDVKAGGAGAVKIYGFIKARGDGFSDGAEKVRYLEANPPIEQSGSIIRIGRIEEREYRNNVTIAYEIETPADTRLVSRTGSGSQLIGGLRGPVEASTGSGSINISNIGSSVEAQTGSGSIELDSIVGRANLRTGSGSIRAGKIAGSVKASTGSGHIWLEQTAAEQGASLDAEAHTGSGGIEIHGVSGSLKAGTGSGSVRADGNPAGDWNINTSSGSVTVEIPPNAAFDLHAATSSGQISVGHPVTVSGTISRKEVRGKVRGGGSLVEVHTSSGSIAIR